MLCTFRYVDSYRKAQRQPLIESHETMTYIETALIQAFGSTFFEGLEYLDNPHFDVDDQDESML